MLFIKRIENSGESPLPSSGTRAAKKKNSTFWSFNNNIFISSDYINCSTRVSILTKFLAVKKMLV